VPENNEISNAPDFRSDRSQFGPRHRHKSESEENNSGSFPRIVLGTGSEVEGYFMRSSRGRRIFAFEGIPYAKAPVGIHRFRVNSIRVNLCICI
jgi:hypothetical protein